jgi:3'-phosphoadenosine 5'-phosphosulfate sulfotransferase (PAPS reductase)/FAD synthetase
MEAEMYELIPQERLVTVKFGKLVTMREIESYVTGLRADPRFDPSLSEIVDFSEVEEFRIEAKEAMALADRIDPFSLSAKRAFVARTQNQIHVARMHQVLRGRQGNIGIFSSYAAAMEWILGQKREQTPARAAMKAMQGL